MMPPPPPSTSLTVLNVAGIASGSLPLPPVPARVACPPLPPTAAGAAVATSAAPLGLSVPALAGPSRAGLPARAAAPAPAPLSAADAARIGSAGLLATSLPQAIAPSSHSAGHFGLIPVHAADRVNRSRIRVAYQRRSGRP